MTGPAMRLTRWAGLRPRPSAEPFACPICGGDEVFAHRGRERARCGGCGALERTRAQFLLIRRHRLVRYGDRILHAAPEPCLAAAFERSSGEDYVRVDLEPERYGGSAIRLDLCADLGGMEAAAWDAVICNHVLEHLRCDPGVVLRGLGRILRPGGKLIFSVPMRRGAETAEDLGELPEAERVRRFGQADHMRMFGSRDVEAIFEAALPGTRLLRLSEAMRPAEMRLAALKRGPKGEPNGASTFLWVRREAG